MHHCDPGSKPDWGLTIAASNFSNKEGVVIGRVLVDGHAAVVPVPIINPMPQTVKLSTLITIGWLEPVQYVGKSLTTDTELDSAYQTGKDRLYACDDLTSEARPHLSARAMADSNQFPSKEDVPDLEGRIPNFTPDQGVNRQILLLSQATWRCCTELACKS